MEVYHSIEDSSITRFSLGIPEDVFIAYCQNLNKELDQGHVFTSRGTALGMKTLKETFV